MWLSLGFLLSFLQGEHEYFQIHNLILKMASSVQNNRVSHSGYCVCCRVCNTWCWRAFKWLPVLLIVSIIVWSYYAYVVQLCIGWYLNKCLQIKLVISGTFLDTYLLSYFAGTITNTVQMVVYLVLYHILLIMFAWSYWRTIFAEIKPIPDKVSLLHSKKNTKQSVF